MKTLITLLFLVVLNVSDLYGSFSKENNGWIYTGEDMTKLITVLEKAKSAVTELPIKTREAIESTFTDIFESSYTKPSEISHKDAAFAWAQASLKRTRNPISGINREIKNIQKNLNRKFGIYINFRPSYWACLNCIWDPFLEERQRFSADRDTENKTWEVDSLTQKTAE